MLFFSAVKGTSNHEKRCTVVTINSSNLLFVLYQSVPCQPCLVCTGCFFFQVVKGISNHERCTAVVTVYSSNLLLVLYQTKCAMSTLFGNAPINKCCYYNNTVYYTSKYCLYLRVGLPFRAWADDPPLMPRNRNPVVCHRHFVMSMKKEAWNGVAGPRRKDTGLSTAGPVVGISY